MADAIPIDVGCPCRIPHPRYEDPEFLEGRVVSAGEHVVCVAVEHEMLTSETIENLYWVKRSAVTVTGAAAPTLE